MKNIYVIDTSSLITAKEYYPMSRFLKVWKNIESLIENKTLIAPNEVYLEIERNDDELLEWAKRYKKMFKPMTQGRSELVSTILKKHPSLNKTSKRHHADEWIIALAIETSRQERLEAYKTQIITEEKHSDAVRIPTVAKEYGIASMSVRLLHDKEDWVFGT